MPDYGHDLRFGVFLTPTADDAQQVVALAQLADRAGLDLVTVQDHPYQSRFLDTWTLLSFIAAGTTNVTVAPNVANLPLRLPAVLARSVATLDLLSGGRVELGLGAGAFWDGIAAMGGPRLAPGEAVTALEEGIRVIRALWDADGGTVRVDGTHHRVVGARPGPSPAHDVQIWLGAYKPRMLRLTGRLADGWLPSQAYADPAALVEMNAVVDRAAQDAGRSPSQVRRLYNVNGRFGSGGGFLTGPAATWAEQLAELTLTQGMSTYVLATDDPTTIGTFAAEVAPAVRELVATARSGAAASVEAGPAAESGPVAASRQVPQRSAEAPATAGRRFAVTPTADDGSRLSGERVWDESTRPSGPPLPERDYTAQEEAAGQHLVDVHDMLRKELRQVRDLLDQVAAGALDPGAARSHINTMTMRQNNWTLGAYCESYCRVVTTHHSLEDVSMFPHLRDREPGLAPVIDRLEQEHHAIHDVLEGVDRALVAFVAQPTGVQKLRDAVDLLTDTLLSHLSYEERELVEPLARHGFTR